MEEGREREKRREKLREGAAIFHLLIHSANCFNKLQLDQTQTKSLELSPGLSSRWQCPSKHSEHLSVYITRELD